MAGGRHWWPGPPGSGGRLSFLIGCSTLVTRVVDRRCEISPVQQFFLSLFFECACVHDGGCAAARLEGSADTSSCQAGHDAAPGTPTDTPPGPADIISAGKKGKKPIVFCTFFLVICLSPPYLRAGNIASPNLHAELSLHIYIVDGAWRGMAQAGGAASTEGLRHGCCCCCEL